MAFVYFHKTSGEFQYITNSSEPVEWNDEYEIDDFDELGIYELEDGVPVKVGQKEAIEFDQAAFDMERLRSMRNELLAATDWWANSDLTMTTEQTEYRQALRDITDNYSSIIDVVWPTKP